MGSRIPRRQYKVSRKTGEIFQVKNKMASDRMWGGLPFIVPSNTAMKYMFHEKVINEEDVPVGAHYRAREDMLNNVRGYHNVKKGLSRRLSDIEHERRLAKSEIPYISTSGVTAVNRRRGAYLPNYYMVKFTLGPSDD